MGPHLHKRHSTREMQGNIQRGFKDNSAIAVLKRSHY